MKKTKEIYSKKAPSPVGHYSQGIIFESLIFCSGQIFPSSNLSIEEETEKVIENLKYVLEEANSSIENVIKVEIFLVDIDDFQKVNNVYSNYFNFNPKPARQVVGVFSLPKGARIEISCIAYVK